MFNIEKELIDIPQLRANEFGGVLGDIDCRMKGGPNYDWKNYRDEDKVTWAHEGTHSVNARIRNDFDLSFSRDLNNEIYYIKEKNAPSGFGSGSINGFYLLNGDGITLKSPQNLTLKDVAVKIPKDIRGRLYDLYLVQQQRYWNDTPLYCFDELTAYLNATFVGIDHSMKARAKESFQNSQEMYGYCLVCRDLCATTQNYEDLEKLNLLLDFLKGRIERLSYVV